MTKQIKIITIGGATFDIFVKANDQAIMRLTTPNKRDEWLCLRYGGKVIVDNVIETFGGGAANTAIAFSRMGFNSSFVGKVGAEYGDKVVKNFKKSGVNTNFVKTTTKDKTAFSTIINTFDGDRTVLGYSGANKYFNYKDLPLNELKDADWFFLNHLTEENSKIPGEILKILNKNPNIKLAWNPGHEQLVQGISKWKKLLNRTEILFLNKEEAALFSKTPYMLAGIKKDDPECHIHVARNFLPPYADDVSAIMLKFFKTGVKNVVITDGKNGSQASDGDRIFFSPVFSHKRIDTLGAGDAFSSGFTSSVILGKSLKDSLIYGTLNANSVINHFGAQDGLLTKSELREAFDSQNMHLSSTRLEK